MSSTITWTSCLDTRQHKPQTNRNTLLATNHLHFSVLIRFLLRWRLIWILEHNIDWLVLFALFAFRAPSHERRLLFLDVFSYLFLARKVGDAVRDKLSSQKRLLRFTGRRASELKSGTSAARWQLVAFGFLLGRTLCGCQRPFASLMGIVGKAGSLPSIPGNFWGLWFGFGTGDRDASCSRVGIC